MRVCLQTRLLWIAGFENGIDFLEVPAPCLDKDEVDNQGTARIADDVEDIEVPADVGDRDGWHVRVDDENDTARQVVES